MLVLLFAVAVIALTLLALLLAGVVVAIVTGIALLNVFALILGLRARRPSAEKSAPERWRPSSFRSPPEPRDNDESEEPARSLTIHRR